MLSPVLRKFDGWPEQEGSFPIPSFSRVLAADALPTSEVWREDRRQFPDSAGMRRSAHVIAHGTRL